MNKEDYGYQKWLSASRIHATEPENGCWVAFAYTADKEVVEYERGDTERAAVEALCKELGIQSYWAIEEQPAVL